MSMIIEQINRLRYRAMAYDKYSWDYKELTDAADTIEELSAKLANANMERSAAYYNDGWIACSERLPEEEGQGYIVQRTDGIIDILGFAKDAYKLDRYDFAEYKGKKKPIFYDFDSEYGYCECGCVAWQPLPTPFKPKGE